MLVLRHDRIGEDTGGEGWNPRRWRRRQRTTPLGESIGRYSDARSSRTSLWWPMAMYLIEDSGDRGLADEVVVTGWSTSTTFFVGLRRPPATPSDCPCRSRRRMLLVVMLTDFYDF